MRKLSFVLVLVFLVCGLAAPLMAEETAYNVEGWKKRVASPTYGLALATLTIKDWDGKEIDKMVVPGFEMRIFNGTNVAKRGGFFVGYEVGTIFFTMEQSDTYSLEANSGAGTEELQLDDFFVGTLFLLSKYGYRIDLGLEAAGLSLGAEVGMGLQLSMGGVDVVASDPDDGDDDDNPETWVEVYAPFSLALEAAGEAAFRLGQNFRIFGRLGVMVMPQLVEWDTDDIAYDGSGPDKGFTGEVSPAIVNLRLGFALNY